MIEKEESLKDLNLKGLFKQTKGFIGWTDTPLGKEHAVYKGKKFICSIIPFDYDNPPQKFLDQCPDPIDPFTLIPRVGWTIEEKIADDLAFEEVDFDCLDEAEETIDYIITGLEVGEVGSLVSAGGTGKSMLAIHTSMLMALGKPSYLSRSQKERKVLYLSLEDKIKGIRNRARRIFKSEKWGDEQKELIKKNFRAVPARMFLQGVKEANWDDIERVFKSNPTPDLLIVDTARRGHRLDENSSTDMNTYMSLLEEIGERYQCAVLILHHTSKAASWGKARGEDVGAGAARGSSAVVDNGRGTWVMVKLPKNQADGLSEAERSRCVLIDHEKCNAEAAMESLILERNSLGILMPLSEDLRLTLKGEPTVKPTTKPEKKRGELFSA